MNSYRLSFWFIRLAMFPFSLLSYKAIHRIGNLCGYLIYYLFTSYRKRCLSNLALAKDLHLTEKQLPLLALKSLQNLSIACLEYPKFAREKHIENIATCENPQTAQHLLKEGKGVIFFCAHQANWEILFLEGTSRMEGIAIGRPIKNQILYTWITSIREKYGGKMILPKNAIKEGLRALKNGKFLGIVGDQGMPSSGFHCPFLGRRAWTSPMPAILSYRTGFPIIFASTLRKDEKYWIHYSEPIWPNQENEAELEIKDLMKKALFLLEKSIQKCPEQWLWSHNRWKQQSPGKIKREFLYESILIILPSEENTFDQIKSGLATFRELYPFEFITVFIPKKYRDSDLMLKDIELLVYSSETELLIKDYRFKLVFNFTDYKKANRHFKRLSALKIVTLADLKKEVFDFSTLLKKLVSK